MGGVIGKISNEFAVVVAVLIYSVDLRVADADADAGVAYAGRAQE